MAQTPASKSALINGAAKDDHIGDDGNFTFTIADLLANDPGGAGKVNVASQFFFGDTAADQADQAGYLLDHGITDNGDGTYTLTSDAIDFHYFVQIGNKGTWSKAAVDVDAPPPTPDRQLFSAASASLKIMGRYRGHQIANSSRRLTSSVTKIRR